MKKKVLKIRPEARMFKSQILMQVTYNIVSNDGHLATAYTEREAWKLAHQALTK